MKLYETRAVLAGVYTSERRMDQGLTHTVEVDPSGRATEVPLCKRVLADSLADPFAHDTRSRPTCTRCLARDPRFSHGS